VAAAKTPAVAGLGLHNKFTATAAYTKCTKFDKKFKKFLVKMRIDFFKNL
jgi:hypothetical protein